MRLKRKSIHFNKIMRIINHLEMLPKKAGGNELELPMKRVHLTGDLWKRRKLQLNLKKCLPKIIGVLPTKSLRDLTLDILNSSNKNSIESKSKSFTLSMHAEMTNL